MTIFYAQPILELKLNIPLNIDLAGVAQWIECQPLNQEDCCFDSQSGHMPGLLARSPVGGM